MAAQNEQSSISQFLFSGMVISAVLAIKFWLFCLGHPDDQLSRRLAAQTARFPSLSIQWPQTLPAVPDKNPRLDNLIDSRICPTGLNDSINIVAILHGEARPAEENIGVPNLVELMRRGVPEAEHPTRCTK